MKKLLAVLSFAVFLAPSITFAAFDTDLRYGSSGAPVLELQEFLTTQGVYSGPITGNFYSLTLAGVKALQIKLGVQPVSGFFGPLTRAAAGQVLAADLAQSDAEASSTPVVNVPLEPVTQTNTQQSTQPVLQETQTTQTQTAAPASFEAYQINYEQPRKHTLYVWVNQEVASVSVPGYTFTKTYEVLDIQNSCTNVPYENNGNTDYQQKCGGDVYRFTPDQPLAEGDYTVTITSKGGDTLTGKISSNGPDY